MAGNVFGNPVTDELVQELYPGQKVTRKLKAQVAFQYINAGGKDVDAKNFVYGLKEQYGNGISAKCMIYNATGDTLTYSGKRLAWPIYESPYLPRFKMGSGVLFSMSTLLGLPVRNPPSSTAATTITMSSVTGCSLGAFLILVIIMLILKFVKVTIMKLIIGTILKVCWKVNLLGMRILGMDVIRM
ncbi:hypothetical protein FEM48_ZijujUnG0098800 [Ziziphus jujuba var. spinosa]|uniref:Uncharacterized protein n=1 Tax=Ziziphus jujuba var. spinosa TaxID=714518 RepID=A0A978U8B0_ZIZJJ|nr:hypothetical protein FEM48_ZijujUnG0098800 [Ziziphus jujuba var. spinosa]